MYVYNILPKFEKYYMIICYMLPIKKIYIDSRDKTSDSASHTDFWIQLPMSISLPANTGFYITDVTIPVSFYTVESNRNQHIYFKVGNINYFRKDTNWKL